MTSRGCFHGKLNNKHRIKINRGTWNKRVLTSWKPAPKKKSYFCGLHAFEVSPKIDQVKSSFPGLCFEIGVPPGPSGPKSILFQNRCP